MPWEDGSKRQGEPIIIIFLNLISTETSVSPPVTVTDYGRTAEMPAWISIAKQKQKIVEQDLSKEEKPEEQDKADAEKQIKEKKTMEVCSLPLID